MLCIRPQELTLKGEQLNGRQIMSFSLHIRPGVNFTNILQAAFSFESFCAAFMCLQFGFIIFWQKDFGSKAAHKMLVKLTPGWKGMSGTNTLAYFASSPVTKKKSLMPLTVVALSRRSRTDSLIIYTPPSVAEAAGATFYIKRSGEIDYVVLLKVSWPV